MLPHILHAGLSSPPDDEDPLAQRLLRVIMGTKYKLRSKMVNLELCVLFGASVTSGTKVLFGEKNMFHLTQL